MIEDFLLSVLKIIDFNSWHTLLLKIILKGKKSKHFQIQIQKIKNHKSLIKMNKNKEIGKKENKIEDNKK